MVKFQKEGKNKGIILERNYGIDLLRILSMFMVVCLHVLNVGGVLWNVNTNDSKLVGNILFTFCMCAVNTFAMISGYVMVQSSSFKFSRLITLWAQVFFYCFVGTVAFLLYLNFSGKDLLSVKKIIKSICPILGNHYWYFTAYFVLFLFLPIVNAGLSSLRHDWYVIILFSTMLLLFFIIFFGDRFGFSDGYSFVWLLVCYFFGGYVKLYSSSVRTKSFIIIFLILSIALGTYRFLSQQYSLPFIGVFSSYLSPFFVINGYCLVNVFSRIKINSNKIVKLVLFFSSGAFGVYLFHENPFFRDYFMSRRFDFLGVQGPFLLVFGTLLCSILIYLAGSLFDYIRRLIFKICKFNAVSEKIESLIERWSLKWK